MSTVSDTEKFLQAVFGADYGTRAIFANLNPPFHTRDLTTLDDLRDCYWSIATFPEDGNATRNIARALEVRALVIDDVGTKVPMLSVMDTFGKPTAVVETSAGNCQWVYRLSAPVAVADWGSFFTEIEHRIGIKLEGRDAVHLFRLPMGVNTKPGKGNVVKLVKLNSGITLSVGNYQPFPTGPGPSGGGADVKLSKAQLEALMKLIPNRLDERDDWIEVGHGLKALCENDDEGFEVFDAWSQGHASYDAEKTRRAWDGLGTSGLRTKGGLLRARAEGLDPEGFRKWDAGVAFDDNPEPPPSSPKGGGGGTTHVDMAERIIGRERGTLGWMSNGPGRWAAFDPVMGRWVIEEHDALMRAAVREEVHQARLGAVPADAKRMAEAKWRGAVQGLLTRERRLMLPFDSFDSDLDMFGVPGGVVRLGAGGITEEAGKAAQMVSKAMNVRPGPRGGRGVAWESFLDDFTMGDPELRRWWQAFCGYCLTGHVHEHAVVFLYGPGGNGKSVFLDTLAEVMGPYHERAGHTLFMASPGAKHMAAVADLVGARLVTSPDVPVGCSWDLGLIKPLTGGGTFKAQFMRENWFKFTPRFKLILAGNEKPELGGVDQSIRRRFWLVPALHMPKTINKQLVDVLRGELPAILRWMLDGWEAYNIGGLPPCAAIDKETEDYLSAADVFGKWKARLVKTPGDMTRHRIGDLWRDWDTFRAGEGSWKASPVNMGNLSTKLKEAGYSVDRDNKGGYVDQISITKSTVF